MTLVRPYGLMAWPRGPRCTGLVRAETVADDEKTRSYTPRSRSIAFTG